MIDWLDTDDGAHLRFALDGAPGAPLVLLWHGAGCTLSMWDLAVERLALHWREPSADPSVLRRFHGANIPQPNKFDQLREWQVLRFDVRGCGQSVAAEDQAEQFSLERYARDAVALLDHVGAARCHVWSMAWGSRAALAFCALHGDRVESAALFDASIGVADVAAQKAGAQRALQAQLAAGIERFARPPGWNEHADPDAVAVALAAAGRFDLRAAAPRLTMPLLVATGDYDPNLASSRELVALAPNARLTVMEGVGHGSVLQRPDLATEVFLHFQASLQAGR